MKIDKHYTAAEIGKEMKLPSNRVAGALRELRKEGIVDYNNTTALWCTVANVNQPKSFINYWLSAPWGCSV